MKMAIAACALSLFAMPSWAQSSYTYDWRTNSGYNTYQQPNGTTQVYGNNYNTGSQWQTTIQPNGNMRGMDSNMNQWNYDAGSKVYQNYGTGTVCVGEGYARVCN